MFVELKAVEYKDYIFRMMHFGAMPNWVELRITYLSPRRARDISHTGLGWTIILSKCIVYLIIYSLCYTCLVGHNILLNITKILHY